MAPAPAHDGRRGDVNKDKGTTTGAPARVQRWDSDWVQWVT